ncbi:MAG TPA: hypothetical protein VHH15_17330 [Actinophytocola sp.]|nr:hypothetical protein [Actinophytocola sp.]
MSDVAREFPGESLELDEYLADFEHRFWSTGNRRCWKIERRQTFVEQGSASYDAFDKGDWEGALKLIEKRRQDIVEQHTKIASWGMEICRVRIVEEPLSPYLIWELNSLRQRRELGENIRVVESDSIAELERDGELPEIVGVDANVAYRVIYNAHGAAARAVRTTDRSTAEHWRSVFTRLFAAGVDMADFFDRRVAGLRPVRTP